MAGHVTFALGVVLVWTAGGPLQHKHNKHNKHNKLRPSKQHIDRLTQTLVRKHKSLSSCRTSDPEQLDVCIQMFSKGQMKVTCEGHGVF